MVPALSVSSAITSSDPAGASAGSMRGRVWPRCRARSAAAPRRRARSFCTATNGVARRSSFHSIDRYHSAGSRGLGRRRSPMREPLHRDASCRADTLRAHHPPHTQRRCIDIDLGPGSVGVATRRAHRRVLGSKPSSDLVRCLSDPSRRSEGLQRARADGAFPRCRSRRRCGSRGKPASHSGRSPGSRSNQAWAHGREAAPCLRPCSNNSGPPSSKDRNHPSRGTRNPAHGWWERGWSRASWEAFSSTTPRKAGQKARLPSDRHERSHPLSFHADLLVGLFSPQGPEHDVARPEAPPPAEYSCLGVVGFEVSSTGAGKTAQSGPILNVAAVQTSDGCRLDHAFHDRRSQRRRAGHVGRPRVRRSGTPTSQRNQKHRQPKRDSRADRSGAEGNPPPYPLILDRQRLLGGIALSDVTSMTIATAKQPTPLLQVPVDDEEPGLFQRRAVEVSVSQASKTRKS